MSEIPPDVIAEIIGVLTWIEANPDCSWRDMPKLLADNYERWKDIIRDERLLGSGGTFSTVPSLSSFGRLFLRSHRGKPEPPGGDRLGQTKVPETLEADPPAVSDNEERVLMYLHDCGLRLKSQYEIAEGTRLARKTVSDCLNRLRKRGLVHRPRGPRKGETLTEKGKELTKELAR